MTLVYVLKMGRKSLSKSKMIPIPWAFEGVIDVNRWTHIAATYDHSNYMLTMYMDGKKVLEQVKADPNTIVEIDGMVESRIGYSGNHASYCDCDVAELEFHSRAFTEQEVVDAYTRFVDGPSCPTF